MSDELKPGDTLYPEWGGPKVVGRVFKETFRIRRSSVVYYKSTMADEYGNNRVFRSPEEVQERRQVRKEWESLHVYMRENYSAPGISLADLREAKRLLGVPERKSL